MNENPHNIITMVTKDNIIITQTNKFMVKIIQLQIELV